MGESACDAHIRPACCAGCPSRPSRCSPRGSRTVLRSFGIPLFCALSPSLAMDGQALVPQQVLAEFITGLTDIRNTRLVSFAIASIVIYDYIVCIEREVELIWKKRWSVIKFAFLWHRYFGLLCVILQLYGQHSGGHGLGCAEWKTEACGRQLSIRKRSMTNCSFWFYWETWGYCGVLFTSEAVLLLWIYVVYNKNRYVLAVMSVCYVAEVASVLCILILSFKHFEAKAFQSIDVAYCVMGDFPPTFKLLWVPILAYDTLLLLLFLWRGCRSTVGCNRKLTYGHDNLLDMVYRHSLLNFLAIFGAYFACAIIWLTSRIGLYQIPVGLALALSITNCTRLLLNIRRAYYSGISAPLLYNIRSEVPATGANTPVSMLDAPLPVPMSPMSATPAFSGTTTLREWSVVSPVSTLRIGSVNVGSQPNTLRISIATTSSEMVRVVAAPAHEGGRDVPSAVYVTPDLDPQWWQYELREMRADPDLSLGEAF
ncbi:hypothetical protein OH77DRAFT_256564 [Trametes cingulata]|nr:hypothetical protein OH77DRAFT_256564 [Trametes cingulata]